MNEESKKKEIFSKLLNKATLRIASALVAILLIVLISVAQFALDPSKINWTSWVGDSVLLVGIQIIFMVIGEGIGKDYCENRINGIYQNALKKYRLTRQEVNNLVLYFGEYHSKYREKELDNKVIQILINKGIRQGREIYYNLTSEEINKLVDEPLEKNGIKFLMISEEKAQTIIDVINNTKIGLTTCDYYLSEYSTFDYISDQDRAAKTSHRKTSIKWGSRTFKIISGVVISLVWSMFTVQEIMHGDDVQGYVNLVSRLFSAITGIITGWLTSTGLNIINVGELQNKELFLHKFLLAYNSKEFIPTSFEEQYEKQKEEAEKKKKERQVEVELVDNSSNELPFKPLSLGGEGNEHC